MKLKKDLIIPAGQILSHDRIETIARILAAASYAKGRCKIISGPKMKEELGHHNRTQIRTMIHKGVIGIEFWNE